MKKQLALFISVCLITISINPLFAVADTKTTVGEEAVALSTKPYENEYGLMANAMELAELLGFEYEFDKENKAFIIFDDVHGEIMLMHNATEFYSGDKVYKCQPYFYVENGVPMIEAGFFCDMFMSSYEYDKESCTIDINIGEMREDSAKLVKDGYTIPLYMTPFYDTCGLMVSIEAMAKAYGVSYEFDGSSAVIDGIYKFADGAEYFEEDGEAIEYYPCFKVEEEHPLIEVGFFTDLFGGSYIYDEETHTLVIEESVELMGADTLVAGTISYNGEIDNETVIELFIQQTTLKKAGVPAAGGSVGEVHSLGEVVLTNKKPQAEYSFDVSEYVSDEYGLYTLLYKAGDEYGYYGRSGGVIPMSTVPEENVTFYPLARHFEFGGTNNADITIGKSGIIEGRIYFSDNSAVTEDYLDVNLMLKTRTTTRYSHYGYTYYSLGSLYELGTTRLEKGDTEQEYSYDTSQYYNSSYPCYTLFYGMESENANIYPYGCYSTDGSCAAASETTITSNYMFPTSVEFLTREYAVADVPLIKASGIEGGLEWNMDLITGELTVTGSGKINSDVPWYSYRSMISSANIDGDITIESNAFNGCSKLASISIGKQVKISGAGVFKGCSLLESTDLGSGMTSIGDSMFEGCSSLKEIVIPPTVTSIGDYAFKDCISLESVAMPENVSLIGKCAFKNCEKLENIDMSEKLTAISEELFSGCTALKTVGIPKMVTTIGNNAFAKCKALDGIVIPKDVISIGNEAFYGCESLSSITLPENLSIIGNWTFYNCSSITDIVIPDSVTSIESSAFSTCESLQNVTMGKNVETIGDSAFYECRKLNSFDLPETVEKIGSRAFWGCELIESVVLPDGLVELGSGAFYDCENLKSINIPSGLDKITDNLFYNCKNLNEIVIPERVKVIGNSAFSNCSSLKDITIPYGVEVINGYAFAYTAIEEIELPNSVEELYYGAFYSCNKLKKVILSQRIRNIDTFLFNGCTSLEEVTIPRSVYSVRSYAFENCTSLQSVIFEGQVSSIENAAFVNMPNTVKIYYPSDVAIYNTYKNKYVQFTWVPMNTYMIRFMNNGGAGRIEYQMKNFGEDLVLTEEVPTKPYYTFMGWSTKSAGTEAEYQPGDTIKNNADLYLYAVWKPDVELNVSENTNGSTRTISVETSVPYENTSVYVAIYDKSGKLISAYKEESNKLIKIADKKSSNQYKCEVMVWNGNMEPLCDKATLILK